MAPWCVPSSQRLSNAATRWDIGIVSIDLMLWHMNISVATQNIVAAPTISMYDAVY
jgi:hypothetical protein